MVSRAAAHVQVRGERILLLLAVVGWGSIGFASASIASGGGRQSIGAAPPALSAVLARPADHLLATIVADGAEILALDASRREVLGYWVRRGGRLLLIGDAVEPALRQLSTDASCRAMSCPLGLGEAVIVRDPRFVAPHSTAPETDDLLAAVATLAQAGLPDERILPLATGTRLLAYGLLLGLGFLSTRGFPRVWRRAGATSLVVVFGLWPWWGNDGPVPEHAAQVDVVVVVDDGPAVIWSAVALRSLGRHSIVVEPGTGSWNLRSPSIGETGSLAEGAGGTSISPDGESFVLDAVRGARFRVAWFADEDLPGKVAVQVAERDGRLVGLVQNRSARPWSDLWLFVPGLEPLRLDDLPPSGAYTLNVAAPGPGSGPTASGLGKGIPLDRARLLQGALDRAIRPLLDRDLPVLVAWSEGPLRPARSPGGRTILEGSTLLISAATTST